MQTRLFPSGPAALVLGLAAACGPNVQAPAGGEPEALHPDTYPRTGELGQGFRPNPRFVPQPPGELVLRKNALRAEGEVLVIEGDARFVTDGGGGSFGITDDNQKAIVSEVLANYPDVFDTIQIYLSFLDDAHAGTAYYQGIRNNVSGIGRDTFDGRRAWGLSDGGRLSGFSNMNAIDQFGPLENVGTPRSSYHAVIAQELSHRWLFYATFRDGTGADNRALLGRDDSHWNRFAHAYGSVQDGLDWRDNGDGTFTLLGAEYAFAPLDRYAMGIYRPDQVEPFYYMSEVSLDGMPVGPGTRIPRGATVQARKHDVTIDQVIASLGPRDPPANTESPYYRAAFVLVTAPGQTPEQYAPYLGALQRIQESFPETYRDWTGGAGAICTKISEACPEAILDVQSWRIRDGNDDLVAPSERFDLTVSVRNDGIRTAEEVQVWLYSRTPGVVVGTATITAPPIPEGGHAELTQAFSVQTGPQLACGTTVSLELVMKTREGPKFNRLIALPVGNKTLTLDVLNEAPDWTVNPDGDDGASAGQWALGEPEFVSVAGIVTQPEEDHSPGEAQLSFHTGPQRGNTPFTHDLDNGTTTLESPVFSIAGATDPTLVFYGWFVAENFAAAGGPVPVPGAALTVLGSNDGGATWKELRTISERTPDWTRFTIRLRPHLEPTQRMKFRFVATDPSTQGTVEAGIDDLEIIDVLPGCEIEGGGDGGTGDGGPRPGDREEEGGCGCSSTSRGSGPALVFLLAALALVLRRRSR